MKALPAFIHYSGGVDVAAYLELHHRGELKSRVEAAKSLLESCSVCPRCCGVNRLEGEIGKCHTSDEAVVSSYGPHFGEEPPLVGKHGSGTIFFTNCNLRCIFCQNYSISQLGEGKKVSKEELAYMMLSLQAQGCHNINLVSPTHVVPQILEALEIAIESGLHLPLVYNSGGYDSIETLKLLNGIIDIYMPDMKYSDEEIATEFSGIGNYPSINKAAVKEMHHQVGDLEISKEGIAQRGLLARHLVLPNGLAGTKEVVDFLAREISPNTHVNIMDQYHPCYKAPQVPGLARRISPAEFQEAIELAYQAGLSRLDGARSPVLRL
ncbi:MAG: radical SAM protein [Dehalococcoidia bacterium]|nr:radical SAM protein [Dehalococcoidia bacterium]